MADDGESPFGTTPAPTAQSIYPADSGATNVELANQFLTKHNASMTARQPEIDNTLSRMQLTTDSMTKMLDDTTAALKASRQGRINNPLLAMGAGMLSNTGNFGSQLGAGLTQMIPQIHADRKEEDDTNLQLAQLALKRGALEQLPLEKKLDYMKALQMGDLGSVRAIEQSLIRAQAKDPNTAIAKQAAEDAKLRQRTVQQAMEEARKAVNAETADMNLTDADKAKLIAERFKQHVEVQRANGIAIPQDVVDRIEKSVTTGSGGQQKNFIEDPTNPEVVARAKEAGLPPPPPTYDPSKLGIKQRSDLLKANSQTFSKESKGWDDASKMMSDLMSDTERAEALLKTKNGAAAVGPQYGALPNSVIPNTSDEAQKLKGLFTKMQLHSVPKGQGAVSNMERELFEKGSPNMGVNADSNLAMLTIQKEIIKRDTERRAFLSDYYNHYRTTDGAMAQWDRYINSAGQAFKYDGSKIVPNTNRMSYKEYFRNEPSVTARRDGGYIKLGAEYD